MKFSYCSDLHLEHAPLILNNEEGSDVLFLAGDILPAMHTLRYARSRKAGSYIGKRGVVSYGKVAMDFMEASCKHYKHVVMIAGNHESYSGNIDETPRRIKEAFSHLKNFTLLEKEDVLIEGVRILGCTLWSKLNPLEQFDVEQHINDYKKIRIGPGYSKLKGWQTDRIHSEHCQWLKERLKQCGDGETVIVMTHHAPCPLSIKEHYRNNKFNAAFASDLSSIFYEFEPDYWLHGHIHADNDYMLGNTRVLAKTRGYPGEKSFKDFKVGTFEIPDITPKRQPK